MKYPGYYQGAAGKWQKSREKYEWDLVSRMCPHIAQKHDELPNWLKARFSVEGTKGPAHTKLTKDVWDIVDRFLEEAINEGHELNTKSVETVIDDAITAYNTEVEKFRNSRGEADLQAVDNLIKNGGSEEAVQKSVQEQDAAKASWPHPIKLGQTERSLNQLALRFSEKYGFSSFNQDKPMKHLRRDHPQVQQVMDFILTAVKQGEVHPKLLCNFDQVWSCLFEPMRRTLWKTNAGQGAKDDLSQYPHRQAIRAAMQEHFGETVDQPAHIKNSKWKAKLADVCGTGGVNTVSGWRTSI